MTPSATVSSLPVADVQAPDAPRHDLFVRLTHWLTAGAFAVLLLSGVAILLAHPRLYWGETGGIGSPSLIDLPLPFVLDVPMTVTDSAAGIGDGLGSSAPSAGYSWYAGI